VYVCIAYLSSRPPTPPLISVERGSRTHAEAEGLIHELQAGLHLAQSQVQEAQAEDGAARQHALLAEEERDQLAHHTRHLQQQLTEQATKADALQRSLDEVTNRYQQYIREAGQSTARAEELLEALEGRESDVELAKALLARSECQLTTLAHDQAQLQGTCTVLEARNVELEERLLEAATGIHKDRQLREEAVLDLAKATMREDMLRKEGQRLTARLQSVSVQLRKDFEEQTQG
jgi:chromosome segregation ATPase